ncbi:Ig-like domain-containing protein [Myroides marinus]|uniref:BIG2 domain-containing protein n=1 Tax=Myroides marinus TaxID=703342 RepID=A0A161SA56_9FLAO|nr:Ig-like domain-containing protein [Myroides marinus]KZE76755.1 hypothetical protein AV926_15220 [Myroides marinus]MDM1376542.1 Ig-like domain-containing protein [Myroides marinus]MDM1378605.1 Ig-like domain-containing protein [Myroides marinus]MDM1383159.1 Ig-like domain-containing protein [Myroides marinus]MDM1385876.1 Ig-like domain-containing protein [Myroides marinus]
MKLKITFFIIFSFLLFNCSSSDKPEIEVNTVAFSFRVQEKQLALYQDFDLLKELVVNEKIDLKNIEFSSSNTNVAIVNKQVLRTKSVGQATITAKVLSTGKTATLKIIVKDSNISFENYTLTVDIDKTKSVDLKKHLVLKDLKIEDIVWISQTPEIAQVDQQGVVSILEKGRTLIFAKVKDNESVWGSMEIFVKDSSVESINILSKPQDNEFVIGNKYKYQLRIWPEGSATGKLVWESSDPSVMSVDQDGNVEAKSEGSATITVKAANGVSSSIGVMVGSGKIRYVAVSLYPDRIINGEKKELSVTILPSSATKSKLRFTSSDTSLATVDQDGVVSSVKGKRGRVTIWATSKDDSTVRDMIDIDIVSAFYHVRIYTELNGKVQAGSITGDLQYIVNLYGLEYMEVSEFKVFDQSGTLLYQDTKAQNIREADSSRYYFTLENAHKPYVTYQLKYKDHIEYRKEYINLR